MNPGYLIRPQADQDIDGITGYLTEQSGVETGLLFLREIDETFSLLGTHKELGRRCTIRHPKLATARVFRVSERFEKFLIFYQPYRDRIEILRVLHGVQDLLVLFEREGIT